MPTFAEQWQVSQVTEARKTRILWLSRKDNLISKCIAGTMALLAWLKGHSSRKQTQVERVNLILTDTEFPSQYNQRRPQGRFLTRAAWWIVGRMSVHYKNVFKNYAQPKFTGKPEVWK